MKVPLISAILLTMLLSMATTSVCRADDTSPQVARPIKLAFVGASITAGYGTANPKTDSFPSQVAHMLGEGWQVRNFGVSGTTLISSGDSPYIRKDAYKQALTFAPDVLVIDLGGNDSKPQNFEAHPQEFVRDYKALVEAFRVANPQVKIYAAQPVPAFPENFGIRDTVIVEKIMTAISQAAAEAHISVIDLHTPMVNRGADFADKVHPNEAGARTMAKVVYNALKKDFPATPAQNTANPIAPVGAPKVSQWEGYERLDFIVDGRACLLVNPHTPLPGKPWIWRTEFFGAFPSVDIALLGKGFAVAYMDVQNMYGAPVALDHMDKFYDFVTKNYGLSTKTVPEGFSRGALFAFNWAARNPDKVACLYVDAPVCDFKRWPKGISKVPGSVTDWERCKKAYGFTTEEQALTYPLNPVDNLKPIADAHIPIIAVYGEADTDLSPEENILIVDKRYRELGGAIQLIPKPGVGHHPHSLADPTPVVNFILTHTIMAPKTP